jgi:hypothetical protein
MSTEPAPQTVFDPSWVERQRQRYGKAPAHARPRLYTLWTAPECQNVRDEIEELIVPLSPDQRRKVIPRLRSRDLFREIYNEMVVGKLLRNLGLCPDYEPELDNLTPDWLVCCTNTGQSFILEVVSSNQSEDREQSDNSWDEFGRRLEQLQLDAHVYFEPPFLGEEFPRAPNGAEQKRIVRDLQVWLGAGRVTGDSTEIERIDFHYLAPSQSGTGLSWSRGSPPFWVDGQPLRVAVKDKVRKYRDLVTARRLPFVVCVVPAFETARGITELRSAVLGTPDCHRLGSVEGVCKTGCYCQGDGLFQEYPTLSAVILAERRVGTTLCHTVLRNPHAAHPLDESIVPVEASNANGRHHCM